MNSPIIASNSITVTEIAKDIGSAVTLLSQCIGIRTVTSTAAPAPTSPMSATAEFSLDGGHMGALLQTPKGKKLVDRSMKLLNPEHRYTKEDVASSRMAVALEVAV